LVGFIIYYVILHQKRVNEYNLQLKEQELKKQQALLVALTEGQENERKRLAEELHDGIGAKLHRITQSGQCLLARKLQLVFIATATGAQAGDSKVYITHKLILHKIGPRNLCLQKILVTVITIDVNLEIARAIRTLSNYTVYLRQQKKQNGKRVFHDKIIRD
jgi:glucose-6-phosphate-specific signal transduction histidine kinase